VVFFHDPSESVRNLMQSFLPYGAPPVNLEETLARIRADAIKSLQQKVNSFKRQGIYCDYKLVENAGAPARGISSESEKGYSLVIMGTHGRNFLLNSFFGSTTRETILQSKIPVIIVHSVK
jgi:nucleotide-binding universal stress UspA family protein